MKSTAPWSVKGIERDARETAKEAARREGMTVGEWLNHLIYHAGEEGSGGAVEGLKAADLVTAIEQLGRKLNDAEAKSAEAVDSLARNFGGVVERVQRLERVRTAGGAPADLLERVERLEAKSSDRQRIEALKALEKAVGQVALQFDATQKSTQSRLDSTEQQLQELASRLDVANGGAGDMEAVACLKDAVDGLSTRIARAERIASEAAKIRTEAGEANVDAEFVERTGERLRILGDEIKRSGDQIRTLESVIKKLSQQIDAAERRSSEGVQKVAETIAELRGQLDHGDAGADQAGRLELEAAMNEVANRADERFAELQRSLDDVMQRLGETAALAHGADEDVYAGARDVEETEDPAPPEAIQGGDDVDLQRELEDAFAAFGDIEAAGDEAESDEDEEAPQPFGRKGAPESAKLETAGVDQGVDGDAFSFDDDDETVSHDADPSGAASLLDEVKSAFAGQPKERAASTEQPVPSADDGASEIDDILAELDGLSGDSSVDDQSGAPKQAMLAANRSPAITRPAPPPALDDDAPPSAPKAKPSASEFLKAARQAAKEKAQQSEEEAVQAGAQQKRQLTPKQRAILAAKIRRKRLAEQGLSIDEPAAKAAAPQREPTAATAAPADEDADAGETESKKSLFAQIGGAFSSWRATLPGGRSESEGEAEVKAPEETDELEPQEDGGNPDITKSARSALRRAGVKPITLALGAAIILAIAALFFLVKDLLVGGGADPSPSTRPAAVAANEETAVAAPQLKDEIPVAPEAPLTQPRELYIESVAKLKTATSDSDTRAALQTLREAAALGHPPAQLQLGELYKLGQGVGQDPEQARLWYERAAQGGNVLAMHRVGVMSARGQGGPSDQDAAIEWFTKAANLGLVDSQYNLGAIYHPAGDGAASPIHDAAKAYFWYSLAAKNGDDQAGSLAAGLAAGLTATERQEIDNRVAGWSAETPDADANEIAPAS